MVSEPGCSSHKSRTCWAGACLAQRCSQHSPTEVQGEGFIRGGSVRRTGRLLPVCPTCLQVSLLRHQSKGAGWEERSCPCLGKCSICLGFPCTRSCPGSLVHLGVTSSTRLAGDRGRGRCSAPAAVPVASGRGWTGAATVAARPRCCRVGPACVLLQLTGLAPGTAFLIPLPNGVTDPTSNPGRCLRSRRSSCPPDSLCLRWGQTWENHQWLLLSRQGSLTQQFDIQREQGRVCARVCLVLWKAKNPRAAGDRWDPSRDGQGPSQGVTGGHPLPWVGGTGCWEADAEARVGGSGTCGAPQCCPAELRSCGDAEENKRGPRGAAVTSLLHAARGREQAGAGS